MGRNESAIAAGAPAEPKPPIHTPGSHPVEIWISYVLRGGTTLAGAIIILGVILFLVHGPGPNEPSTFHDLTEGGGHSIATSWWAVVRGTVHGQALDIIRLGLLVLILTPTTRVAMTVGLFIAERDRAFIVATVIVLIVLIIGLIGVGS